MTKAILQAPMHPREQVKCFGYVSKSEGTRHPAPRSCRKDHTVFPLKNKTTEPENSMHVGTNATSALSNVIFMASSVPMINNEKEVSG